MSIFSRFDDLIKTMETFFDLEKGDRKIVDTTKKWKSAVENKTPAVQHKLDAGGITMHTGSVKYAPAGSHENTHDHATYSEHVILHHNQPIGYATVHHAHPLDHGRANDAHHGTAHEHSVAIHAPGIHEDAHAMLRGKVKEHVNSRAFKNKVDEHNQEVHDYVKPKFHGGNSKVQNKYK